MGQRPYSDSLSPLGHKDVNSELSGTPIMPKPMASIGVDSTSPLTPPSNNSNGTSVSVVAVVDNGLVISNQENVHNHSGGKSTNETAIAAAPATQSKISNYFMITPKLEPETAEAPSKRTRRKTGAGGAYEASDNPQDLTSRKHKASASDGRKCEINATTEKPDPVGEPPVWARNRQQLCETLPYYRAYQSGAYHADKVVKGLMLDSFGTIRDVISEQVVISRVGGGYSAAKDGEGHKQSGDQKTSIITSCWQRTMSGRLPVAVIISQKNPNTPCKLTHYYNVLDWFHVTDMWTEKSGGYITWMVRLEKVDLTSQSWWSPKVEDMSPVGPETVQTDARTIDPAPAARQCAAMQCAECKETSKEIYTEGWACLTAGCSKFFDFGHVVDDQQLTYHPAFLQERTSYTGNAPGPLSPPLISDADLIEMSAFRAENISKKGIVCPDCRCCVLRRHWDQWACESCGHVHRLSQRPVPIEELVKENIAENKITKEYATSGIKKSKTVLGRYEVIRYIISDPTGVPIGSVTHLKADAVINQQPNGPDDMFQELQTNDLHLYRNAARHRGLPIELLTAHHASNWGVPYKYGVNQTTTGFSKAPDVILRVLKRLTWAGKQAVGEEDVESFHDFNELLSLGFLEGGSIHYHDDGEKTLGPTVASISLGATATMHWRIKTKWIKQINSDFRSKGNRRDDLIITLNHGDIMVMHGAKIQEYYEHAVSPHGLLRFALTCRYILPDNAIDQAIANELGALPANWRDVTYDGEHDGVATAQA